MKLPLLVLQPWSECLCPGVYFREQEGDRKSFLSFTFHSPSEDLVPLIVHVEHLQVLKERNFLRYNRFLFYYYGTESGH